MSHTPPYYTPMEKLLPLRIEQLDDDLTLCINLKDDNAKMPLLYFQRHLPGCEEEYIDFVLRAINAHSGLLEALKDMVSDYEYLSQATLDFARSMIAKAEGKQNRKTIETVQRLYGKDDKVGEMLMDSEERVYLLVKERPRGI